MSQSGSRGWLGISPIMFRNSMTHQCVHALRQLCMNYHTTFDYLFGSQNAESKRLWGMQCVNTSAKHTPINIGQKCILQRPKGPYGQFQDNAFVHTFDPFWGSPIGPIIFDGDWSWILHPNKWGSYVGDTVLVILLSYFISLHTCCIH